MYYYAFPVANYYEIWTNTFSPWERRRVDIDPCKAAKQGVWWVIVINGTKAAVGMLYNSEYGLEMDCKMDYVNLRGRRTVGIKQ
jgi:hypothetical protein